MYAQRSNGNANSRVNFPVVFGTRPRLSNRFDELLLNNNTSRSPSPNRENNSQQLQSTAPAESKQIHGNMQTKFSAASFKLEYPDGRTVERSEQRGTVVVERGSLTDRRVDLASTGTPNLCCPTQSAEGEEIQLDPITHTLSDREQQLVRPLSTASFQRGVRSPQTQLSYDRSERRLLNKMGSQSTAFTESSTAARTNKVKPLFKRPINEQSNFRGMSVAEVSRQIKAKYSKDRRKVLVSQLDNGNRRPSSQRMSQPVIQRLHPPPPTITVTTESMFRRQNPPSQQSTQPTYILPDKVIQETGRADTNNSQYSFKRSSYSARLLEQRAYQGGGSQPTIPTLRHFPTNNNIITSNLIPPPSSSRTRADKCTLLDNRCFGFGCNTFRAIDEYELMPLDERGHSRQPIYR